ncbi:hypothetical protein TELCIR_11857, partial [Teladorsagia circumcincta]
RLLFYDDALQHLKDVLEMDYDVLWNQPEFCLAFLKVGLSRQVTTRSAYAKFVISAEFIILLRHAHYLPSTAGMILGNFVGGTLYLGGVLTQVLASVNRLIASFSIHLYNRFCTLRNTTILIAICWIGTFSLAVAYSLNHIGYVFDEVYLVWAGDGQPQSADAFAYVGIMVYASTAAMFIMNVITFGKLLLVTRSNTVLSNTESTKRMKRNKVLLAQKVSQDSLYLVDMLFAQVLSGLLPYNWWTFLCLTFVWLSLNTIDGIVMIVFVKELSDPVRHQFQRILSSLLPSKKSQDQAFVTRKTRMMSVATVSNSLKS